MNMCNIGWGDYICTYCKQTWGTAVTWFVIVLYDINILKTKIILHSFEQIYFENRAIFDKKVGVSTVSSALVVNKLSTLL